MNKPRKSTRSPTYQSMQKVMDSFKLMESEENEHEARWKVLDEDNGRVYEITIIGRERRDDE